jgi:hypothetical protein
MSAYEELVEQCAKAAFENDYHLADWPLGYVADSYRECARIMLAVVLRTLETVTPKMARASNGLSGFSGYDGPVLVTQDAEGIVVLGSKEFARYLAMLRASPLEPPK